MNKNDAERLPQSGYIAVGRKLNPRTKVSHPVLVVLPGPPRDPDMVWITFQRTSAPTTNREQAETPDRAE